MDTVLVFGGTSAWFGAFGDARRMGDGEIHVSVGDEGPLRRELAVLFERDADRGLRRLTARSPDVVIVDARGVEGSPDESPAAVLLEKLFPKHEVGGPARRKRTLVLVDGDAKGARLAFLAGLRRVAGVLVAPSDADIVARIVTMTSRVHGRIALCLAGGGIEGLLYEVGVIRALDHFLEDRDLCDLDMFYGISAGAVLGAFLANGLTPDEIASGLRRGNDKLDRMSRRDLFDPNLGELGTRLLGLVRDVLGFGEARNPISALYRAVPSGAFAGDALREYLRRQFARSNMSDSFDDLRRPLFVGATDQDTNEAVVFGDTGWRDVPVHKAVRASCALAPFYRPERVGGRYYIDGAFTRTTNMRVAVKNGASLVLIVDPLVPIYSEIAGYVRKRGGIFGTMQGLKGLINQRFDKADAAIREMYPEVAFHLFRPEGDEMRILSGSPMKFLYRQEIEQLAYQRTLRKIRAHLPELTRDFARHGVVFREPARVVRGESPFEDGLVAA
jgi:predicted acylesterase/phospholipase RssA